jgi:acetylglutamate kinase
VRDIILLHYVGIKVVVVHGGGPEISEKMEKMGKKPEFISGLRITDKETLEIVEMVLDGIVNSKIVSMFMRNGGKAVGLSGRDGTLVIARKKPPKKVRMGDEEKEVDLGFVGETDSVNPEILKLLLDNGFIPVVSPIAIDKEGNRLNLNADIVAGELASALHAKRLIMLTDVPGILRKTSDRTSVISRMKTVELESLVTSGVLDGGMIPKAQSCLIALKGGVEKAHILDGSKEHALLLELFTDEGVGTMVEP